LKIILRLKLLKSLRNIKKQLKTIEKTFENIRKH
jgi:hypothetical protein